jgi:hypothetical protein
MFNINFNSQKKSNPTSGRCGGKRFNSQVKGEETQKEEEAIVVCPYTFLELIDKGQIKPKNWNDTAFDFFGYWYGENEALESFLKKHKDKVSKETWKEIIEYIQQEYKEDEYKIIPLIKKYIGTIGNSTTSGITGINKFNFNNSSEVLALHIQNFSSGTKYIEAVLLIDEDNKEVFIESVKSVPENQLKKQYDYKISFGEFTTKNPFIKVYLGYPSDKRYTKFQVNNMEIIIRLAEHPNYPGEFIFDDDVFPVGEKIDFNYNENKTDKLSKDIGNHTSGLFGRF